MKTEDFSRMSPPPPTPGRSLEVGIGGDVKLGIGAGGEGEKLGVNVVGFNVQASYDITNNQRSFAYGPEIGVSVALDFNPVTAGGGGPLFFQRYFTQRGDTVTTGYRYGSRAYGEGGLKVGLGVGAGVKGAVEQRDMIQVEATFKNGSFDRLSEWDKTRLHPLNPFPSMDRARELARERPNEISVNEKHRSPTKISGGGTAGASGYLGGGGSVSGFGRIALNMEDPPKTEQ